MKAISNFISIKNKQRKEERTFLLENYMNKNRNTKNMENKLSFVYLLRAICPSIRLHAKQFQVKKIQNCSAYTTVKLDLYIPWREFEL